MKLCACHVLRHGRENKTIIHLCPWKIWDVHRQKRFSCKAEWIMNYFLLVNWPLFSDVSVSVIIHGIPLSGKWLPLTCFTEIRRTFSCTKFRLETSPLCCSLPAVDWPNNTNALKQQADVLKIQNIVAVEKKEREKKNSPVQTPLQSASLPGITYINMKEPSKTNFLTSKQCLFFTTIMLISICLKHNPLLDLHCLLFFTTHFAVCLKMDSFHRAAE